METGANEATLLDLLSLLWSRKWILAGVTTIVAALGTGYGFLLKPIYRSEAIIAPKDAQAGANPSALLAQMGGLGGMVASHLGFGRADLNRLEVVFKSREVAEAVISEHDLLPRLFPGTWDSVKSQWETKGGAPPSLREGTEFLKRSGLSVQAVTKKNILIVGMSLGDSVLSARVLGHYLDAVNEKIKRDAKREAEANREYLMGQMAQTGDPMLQEKIQQLMANEIEKTMLMSSNSFDLLEKPAVPYERDRPNRKLIAIFSVFLGLSMSSIGIIGWNAFGKNRGAGTAG